MDTLCVSLFIDRNVPTGLNNVKTKLDNLDVVELKSLPVDLKKLSDLVKMKLLKAQIEPTKDKSK